MRVMELTDLARTQIKGCNRLHSVLLVILSESK
jgi:hypothetical protein